MYLLIATYLPFALQLRRSTVKISLRDPFQATITIVTAVRFLGRELQPALQVAPRDISGGIGGISGRNPLSILTLYNVLLLLSTCSFRFSLAFRDEFVTSFCTIGV
jgi:hypothetical protein